MEFISQEEYEEIKSDPFKLFSTLRRINDKEKRKQIMFEIDKEGSVDICEYAVKAFEGGVNVVSIIAIMKDIIEKLKLKEESLLNYFRIIDQSTHGDTFRTLQNVLIQKIAISQPEFAYKFFNHLSTIDEPFVYQYRVEIILSLGKFEIEEKHSMLLLMANSNDETKSICGIIGLGRLKYNTEKDCGLIRTTLSCFVSLKRKETHTINGSITQSLTLMYSLGDDVISQLVEISKNGDPYVLMQIVRFLYCEYDKIHDEYYFKPFLFLFVEISSNYRGIIKELDMLLYAMVNSETNIDLFIDFMINWMSKTDCKPDKILFLQMLDMTFSEICNKSKIFQKIITELLNNDNMLAPELASTIITSNRILINYPICLDAEILFSLSCSDVDFICRRICGYITDPEVICSLFFSILKEKINDEKTVTLIASFFNEYIGHNYPKTTIDFFERILNESKSDTVCNKILSGIFDAVKKSMNEQTSLPRLKELEPAGKDYHLLYREEWRTNQKNIEMAKSEGIVDLIASRAYIKYGKSVFYHVNEEFTEPTVFKSISFSMELPYELIVDPINLEYNNYLYRNTKRKEN